MMLHAANNTIAGGFVSPMFSDAAFVRLSWLLAALWWLAALVVVLVAGPSQLKRSRTLRAEYGRTGGAPVKHAVAPSRISRVGILAGLLGAVTVFLFPPGSNAAWRWRWQWRGWGR